jgi:hypothetical protein
LSKPPVWSLRPSSSCRCHHHASGPASPPSSCCCSSFPPPSGDANNDPFGGSGRSDGFLPPLGWRWVVVVVGLRRGAVGGGQRAGETRFATREPIFGGTSGETGGVARKLVLVVIAGPLPFLRLWSSMVLVVSRRGSPSWKRLPSLSPLSPSASASPPPLMKKRRRPMPAAPSGGGLRLGHRMRRRRGLRWFVRSLASIISPSMSSGSVRAIARSSALSPFSSTSSASPRAPRRALESEESIHSFISWSRFRGRR